ncbi:MAG: hypothetical protein WB680_12085 [Candidatus Acidiferrales bacterium]
MQKDFFQASAAETSAQFFQRAFGGQPAFIDDHRVGAQPGDVVHQVRGKQNGGALLGLLGNQVVKKIDGLDVQAVGGLIEH